MNDSLQAAINRYWTDRAPSYDAYQQRPERRRLDAAAWSAIWSDALAPARTGAGAGPLDVLDVGTGSGHVACLLAGLGHRVTGVDLSPGMLELARAHADRMVDGLADRLVDGVGDEGGRPPRFLIGDAVALDFEPASFDAVVGRYVMWTLRDPEEAVRTWARLLRPGGVVAMVDSTWFTTGLGTLYGERPDGALPLADARDIEQTAETMRRTGLRHVEITPLESILRLDEEYGVAEGHEVQLQYLLTGRVG